MQFIFLKWVLILQDQFFPDPDLRLTHNKSSSKTLEAEAEIEEAEIRNKLSSEDQNLGTFSLDN